jgi:hypothetical protein
VDSKLPDRSPVSRPLLLRQSSFLAVVEEANFPNLSVVLSSSSPSSSEGVELLLLLLRLPVLLFRVFFGADEGSSRQLSVRSSAEPESEKIVILESRFKNMLIKRKRIVGIMYNVHVFVGQKSLS